MKSINNEAQYAKALEYALFWHQGQMDKTGKEPYSLHTVRVSASPRLKDWIDRQIGAGHDLFEDTKVPRQKILEVFGTEVYEAIVALTHLPDEPRREYLARVKANERAKRVKYADIYDNINRSKEGLDDFTIKRLQDKYQSYLKILDEK